MKQQSISKATVQKAIEQMENQIREAEMYVSNYPDNLYEQGRLAAYKSAIAYLKGK